MAWAVAATAVTGNVALAADFNNHRDDLSHLGGTTGITAMQLINEFKGFPANVLPDADLATLNLWWDSVGTPTTAPTFVDVAGEAGITETYEHAIKVVTDDVTEGARQRFTYADEPRIKSGRVISALVAVWSVAAASITAKLLNSDASETAAAAVSAAAWTVVEIPAHSLAGTYVDFQITAAAAGTFYFVPLGLNIGTRPYPLGPRPLRYVDYRAAAVVSSVDLGGAGFTDVDVSASVSALCVMVELICLYQNTTNAGNTVHVRRNGDSVAANTASIIARNTTTAAEFYSGSLVCAVDDARIFEYSSSAAAGDTESIILGIKGYWEWA